MLALLLLVQVVPGPPGPEDEATPAPARCQRGGEEIVACGRPDEDFRLPRLDAPARQRGATTRIAPNKTLSARAEPGPIASAPAPRAMIDLTIDF